ncbi:MAG: MFS transporter [Marinobacterium sp.]|nr:MFS transporter [Marinobacterium sp.]
MSAAVSGRKLYLLIAAGALILAYSMGVRQSMGLLVPDISQALSIPLPALSFSFAVQNLVWGAVAPVAGLMAERYGTVKVLLVGALLYGFGLIVSALSQSEALFFVGNALLIGLGTGATTFPLVLAAVGKRVSEKRRTLALGITSAGGSLGQFLYAMSLGFMGNSFDWSQSLLAFAGSTVVVLALAGLLKDQPASRKMSAPERLFDWQQIAAAMKVREYQLLNIGFFVCGFHIAFITVHLAGVVSFCGLPPQIAADSMALIGLVNIVGGILVGWAGDRWHKPWLLTLIYWLRACLIMALLLLPPTETLFYGFAVLMGALWLSTVPLTSGTVAQIFGPQQLASLFGIVMFSHQIGAFFGSWLSGLMFEWYGDWQAAMLISAGLGLLAAIVHLPITPQRLDAFRAVSD